MIVAVSENGVIGKDGGLPWHLPADLRHFKNTTMGHHLIIGRRTWDEVGKPLPGRTMVVVTRSRHFSPEGVKVAHSIEEALEVAVGDGEPFIGGGAYIYRIALGRKLVDQALHHPGPRRSRGRHVFPRFDFDDWELVSEEHREADEKNDHAYTFEVYDELPDLSGAAYLCRNCSTGLESSPFPFPSRRTRARRLKGSQGEGGAGRGERRRGKGCRERDTGETVPIPVPGPGIQWQRRGQQTATGISNQ